MPRATRNTARILIAGAVLLGVLFTGLITSQPAQAFTKRFQAKVVNNSGYTLYVYYQDTCRGNNFSQNVCDTERLRSESMLQPGESTSDVHINPTILIGHGDRVLKRTAQVILKNPLYGRPTARAFDGGSPEKEVDMYEGEDFTFTSQGHTITVKREHDSDYKEFTITVD